MAELIWEGKYDKGGRRTAPLRVALPFQTVETVNESTRQRHHEEVLARQRQRRQRLKGDAQREG